MTNEGLELIKSFEGLRLKAYKCPAGVWTIGYGHTRGVKEGDVISEGEAEEMLRQDLVSFEINTRAAIIPKLTEYQHDALTSLAYNIGMGNFRKSTLLRIINMGITAREDIEGQFMRWVYAGGKKLPGLVRRRTAEVELYFLKP
jgi:lysozyme